jgi:hypothetical protein
VRPTPRAAEPERPNFAFDVEGGGTITDSIRVRNFGADPLVLAIYASDALTTSTGGLDLLPAGETPTDVGAWISLTVESIVVPPRAFVDVPFSMVVPANAASGDHTGGIVTSITTGGENGAGEPVRLDRRLGTRVQVRVGGELRPQLVVSALSTGYSGTVNPFGAGTMRVDYTVTNTGNVRLAADQVVKVEGPLGVPSRRVQPDRMPELLPGNSLSFSVEIDRVWPAVRHKASVELHAYPTRPDDVGPLPATRAATVWTVPWGQVLAVVVVVTVTAVLLWNRARRRWTEASKVRHAVKTALAEREGWT